MKLKRLSILSVATALLFAATSCSNDDALLDANKPLENSQSFYLPISVNGFGNNYGSRANEVGDYDDQDSYDSEDEPNFSEGETFENKVESVYLVFYDSNGNRVYASGSITSLTGPTPSTPASENSIYSGVVKVDVERGSALPAYVLAFVNPSNVSDFKNGDDFSTLEKVEKSTRESLINDGNFAMSNSVYYGKDAVTGAENVRIMATPIATGKLFTSEAEAKKAMEEQGQDAIVDIYVERYAGKVNFNVKGIQGVKMTNAEDGEEVTLTFVPEYWTVNAVESESYVTKTFFAENSETPGDFDWNAPASYATLNGLLSPWFWNSSANHRSYWGQSPSYYKAKYPRVADDILDDASYNATSNPNGPYSLRYYSYNDLANANRTALDAFARDIQTSFDPIYTRENTVAGTALRAAAESPDASPRAAIASVVMVGRYQVNGEDAQAGSIFYVTGNSTNGYTYYTKEAMEKYFLQNSVKLATLQDEEYVPVNEENFDTYLEIVHPSAAVRGNLVVGSRYVTMQLKDAAKGNVYAKIGDGYVQVTDANIVSVNQSILSSLGLAFGFSEGRAYFNIPIQHLGYYRSTNTNLYPTEEGGNSVNANSADFDWSITKSGDFGVVRNHVYTVNVNSISGLGNGIPNPSDPIVPQTDPEDYYIGARIVVLNWAIVPAQNIDL